MEKKFGPMMQMAFVVDDFDEPINFWTKKMNIGPFFKLEHLNLKDVYYMDKPTELDFSVAIAYTGNMQIELVNQHCDTPSIYNEYVNNEKGPLHHLCTLTNDIENDIRILRIVVVFGLFATNNSGILFRFCQPLRFGNRDLISHLVGLSSILEVYLP